MFSLLSLPQYILGDVEAAEAHINVINPNSPTDTSLLHILLWITMSSTLMNCQQTFILSDTTHLESNGIILTCIYLETQLRITITEVKVVDCKFS